MASLYGRPTNITGFRKIKVAHRKGQTPESMLALHETREKRNKKTKSMSVMAIFRSNYESKPKNVRTITIDDASQFKSIPSIQNKKLKNWNGYLPTLKPSHIQTNNEGTYSSRCRYIHYTYTRMVTSWGCVVNPQFVYVRIDTNDGLFSKNIKAPRGFHWTIDKNGIKLQSNSIKSKDYHPSTSDFLVYRDSKSQFHTLITDKANQLYEKRKSILEEQFIEKRMLKNLKNSDCYVSFLDSINAGNCPAGTISWIERNNLEKNKHYKLSVLLRHLENDQRVKLAAIFAYRRHEQEIQRGYSKLAEHYLNYPVKS